MEVSKLKDLLGETLKSGSGGSVNVESLFGPDKVIGLYFSAHWCPPCRAFTPKVEDCYKHLRSTDKGKSFEIVFVSSDRDDESFREYFSEMPWLALPFEDRERKARLTKKYKIEGIPTLILIDAETTAVITKKARDNIVTDPEGNDFPWFPKSIRELVVGPLLTNEGKTVTEEVIQGKVIGFYFSAHWCPPCRSFTPKLMESYKKITADGKPFEVIFVSADRTKDSFEEYSRTMPWLALPYDDTRRNTLPSEFEVGGIPCLVLMDANYKIITNNGRGQIEADPDGSEFPWHPKPVEKLTDMVAGNVNEMACLILFTRGVDETVSQAESLLMPAAVAHRDLVDSNPTVEPLCFMYEVKEGDEIADSIMEFTQLEERYPQLVIVDIPEQKKYSLPASEPLTPETVQRVVSEYRVGTLNMDSLRQ